MAGTGETGGLSGLALGGAVAAVVVIGGATMAWLGLFSGDDAAPVPRDEAANAVAISPSAQSPEVTEGVSQQPDPVEPERGEDEAEPVEQASSEAPATQASAVVEAETATEEDVATPDQEVETAAEAIETEPTQDSTAEEPDAVETEEDEEEAVALATQAPVEQPTEDNSITTQQPVADSAADAETLFEAPLLDLVRVGPTGETVIAGRAAEGVLIEILLDGDAIEQVEVQPGGDFVAFADLPASNQARVISLRASADGQERLSDSSFIVAPANPAPADPVETAAAEVETREPALAEVAEAVGETAEVAETTLDADAPVGAETEVGAQVGDTSPDEVAETETVQTEIQNITAAAETEAEAAEAEQGTQLAQAPEGLATEAPETGEPAAAVASPEVSAVEEEVTARAEPIATQQGSAEESSQVETRPAPQPAPAQVAVLRADADGVTLVQPIAQKPQGKVVLDTISYSDSGEVQLAGRAGAASNVLVYLNNTPAAQFTAQENGSWGGRLDAVEPGVYTLRLDEVDAAGKVLSRLETPFKREAPEALQPPVAEGATGETEPLVRAVTVQEGDTLWAISQQRYGSGFLYVRVFEANQGAIRDPDLIYPGQVFALPE